MGGGGDLHGVAELLWPLRLLGEHRVRRLADGDAAQRLADGMAQLFGWRLLRGGGGRGGEVKEVGGEGGRAGAGGGVNGGEGEESGGVGGGVRGDGGGMKGEEGEDEERDEWEEEVQKQVEVEEE